MKALIQRVSQANVEVESTIIGSIQGGLLIFLGVGESSQESEISTLVQKIAGLRIFEDEQGKMNRSALDIKADVLIISQFTLYADCRRGKRPDFIQAAKADKAKRFYELFIEEFKKTNLTIATGQFGAHMKVSLLNDGPVTIMLP